MPEKRRHSIYCMELDGEVVPEPSPIEKLKLEPTQVPILIEIFMPMYRKNIDNS